MSIINFLHTEADLITESPVTIPFSYNIDTSIPNGSKLDDFIVISPVTVETWFRMKPFLIEIESGDFNKLVHGKLDLPDIELVKLIMKYDACLMQIIFLGIHNAPGEMPDWKKQALISNCNWQDIHILVNAILFRIGQKSFYKSITVLQNVSPLTEAEIIAAQNNLESWKTVQVVQ